MATTEAEPMTNGTATPPAPVEDSTYSSASSGTKRKREDSEVAPQVTGSSDDVSATAADTFEASEQLKEVLKDILAVLRR